MPGFINGLATVALLSIGFAASAQLAGGAFAAEGKAQHVAFQVDQNDPDPSGSDCRPLRCRPFDGIAGTRLELCPALT
jgi:hypothetical protein